MSGDEPPAAPKPINAYAAECSVANNGVTQPQSPGPPEDDERDDSPLGFDRAWSDAMDDIEKWLDTHYPLDVFGGHLMYGDGSGVDTTNGFGPSAVRALRLGIAQARGRR